MPSKKIASSKKRKNVTAVKKRAGKAVVTVSKARKVKPSKASSKAKASKTSKASSKTKTKTKTKTKAKAKVKVVVIADETLVRPTRSRTSYMMFVKDTRKKTQTDNPDMSFADITRDVAMRWRGLSDRERKKYDARAAKDKIRYQGEVAKFREAHPGQPLIIKKKKRVPKIKGPKRARSAYVFYTIAKRPGLKDENTEMDFGALTKLVAKGWNELSENGRKQYEKMSGEDKTRYSVEIKDFNIAHPEIAMRKKRRRKDAPKKARSAYLFYTMEKRSVFSAEHPNTSFGELTQMVAESWKSLSAAQRKQYEKQATSDRSRYENEMESYVPMTDAQIDAEIEASGKKSKKRRKDGPKHARSAYLYFTMEERPKARVDHPEKKFGEITQILANAWNELEDGDKGAYNKLAIADKARYEEELNTFNSQA